MSTPVFAGRVAVVTGAASGIGLAVAQQFAAQGASVALLDRDPERGQAAAAQLRSSGADSECFAVDVALEPQIIQAVDRILTRFQRVHHLVNNAGIVLVKSIQQSTAAEWDQVMNVNARSVFLMVKHLLPALRSSPGATIVNVGSVSSLVAQRGTPAYVASKGAVLMLSKALALDLAVDGIRVNCVCPGITDTPMFRFHVEASPDPPRTLRERTARVPLGRMLAPREIADAVLYLSGSQSSGITGTELIVDAGYTATAEWPPA